MGHGGGRGPGNSSPQTAPNHHTKMGQHIRTSASVTGLYCVTVFHSLGQAENHHTINFSRVQVIEAEALCRPLFGAVDSAFGVCVGHPGLIDLWGANVANSEAPRTTVCSITPPLSPPTLAVFVS